MALLDTLWSTPTRKAVTSISAFFGLIAAFGGAVKAWPEVEPLLPAHRGYVVFIADERVAEYKPAITSILKYQTQDSIAKTEAEIAQWNIKLPTEQDAQTRNMIQGRIRELEAQRSNLQQRLNELSK